MTNHNELMSNYFAQPDALAVGKSTETLKKEGVPDNLLEHKHFTGDRPSLSLLFLDSLTAYNTGQLLALYEHRVATEGFIYDCNSFDQWGVELGKVLAKETRAVLSTNEKSYPFVKIEEGTFNSATQSLMQDYLEHMGAEGRMEGDVGPFEPFTQEI